MKKILSLLMFICLTAGTMTAQVDGQGYLVLQTADGQLVLKDADIDKITFDIRNVIAQNQSLDHMCYVIGYDVADGQWGFDIPSSRVPMYIEDEDNGILTYTGYFAGGGFKVMGEDWSYQWSQRSENSFGDFIQDNGEVIKVPSPGFYTIRLDIPHSILTITSVDMSAPSYGTVSLSGDFNGWEDTPMQRVQGTNSYDWYAMLNLTTDSEVKFKADYSWDVNWGSSAFPSGRGEQNGVNIPVKAGSYVVLFNELTGYYHFFDSDNPVPVKYSVPDYDLTIEPGDTYVDFGSFENPMVQLFKNVQIPLTVEYEANYKTEINSLSYDGLKEQISTSELQGIVKALYGNAPVDRELTVTVSADVTVNGYPEHYSASTTITCKLPTPDMPENLYFIGATDGWMSTSQHLATENYDGVYTGFCYVADPNGWGLEFKLQRTAGNWDTELNAGSFVEYIGDVKGMGENYGNIGVTAGEGVYYMSVDLNNLTFTAVKVEQMSIIGSFNGWWQDVDMTWDAESYSYKATGVGATADGWKIRINHDWKYNLGGQLSDLRFNGVNITVNANTIELFPTRRDGNTIYCTVE